MEEFNPASRMCAYSDGAAGANPEGLLIRPVFVSLVTSAVASTYGLGFSAPYPVERKCSDPIRVAGLNLVGHIVHGVPCLLQHLPTPTLSDVIEQRFSRVDLASDIWSKLRIAI